MANASAKFISPPSKPEQLGQWLFDQSRKWRTVLAFVLVGSLSCISICFNVELGKLSAVDSTSQQLLPAGYALLDLAVLFLSGFVGLKTRSILRKFIAWVWFAFLLCLSLWAAASFTLSVDTRLEHAETYHAIEAKQSELETQSKTVALWQKNLAETTLFKTRYTDLLNSEQEKLRQIQSEMEALESRLPPATMAIYEIIGPRLDLAPETLSTFVRLLWAAALTLSPIVLVLLIAAEFGLIKSPTHPIDDGDGNRKRTHLKEWLGSFKHKSPYKTRPSHTDLAAPVVSSNEPERVHSQLVVSHQNVPERVRVHKLNKKPKSPVDKGVQRDTGTDGKARYRYEDLKKSVLAKRTRPSIRGVRSYCGCRQSVAQRYIDALMKEGVIERASNGWFQLKEWKLVDNG